MYIYESHHGGIFVLDTPLTDTYCELCRDWDILIGKASTIKEAQALLLPLIDGAGYNKEDIAEVLESALGVKS